jgi:transitional endoplasmic reticulum ATPase
MTITLAPAQQRARIELERAARPGNAVVLFGASGRGKTTILRDLHREVGGQLLGVTDFMAALDSRHPLQLEETLYGLLTAALAKHAVVMLDDLHLIANISCCSSFYPRQGFITATLAALAAVARASERSLVFGSDRIPLPFAWQRGAVINIPDFAVEDYGHICRAYLDDAVAGALDYTKIHRFARKLGAHELRSTCMALRASERIDTDVVIEHLRAHQLAANVDLGEVQPVELRDLKGVDDVLEALEANIILPLENAELAAELGLMPKRGVLLAGPPGTGKTTVARALAHRLKSKFFLIDGTVISGTGSFYGYIHQVFEDAKRSAPAIIFIDDSDVLFEAGTESGFYRYLLTILDGVESESAGRICLMMTAMDIGNMPPALVRSGRIELWLETRLPDEAARAAILDDRCAGLPAALGSVDTARLAAETDGLSGADLRRLVDDGKVLYAYDRARGRPLRPTIEYFLSAIDTVRANRQRYAEAEARAHARRPQRPSFFDFIDPGMQGWTAYGSMGVDSAGGYAVSIDPAGFTEIEPREE